MRPRAAGGFLYWRDYSPFGETLEEQAVAWGCQCRYTGNEDDGGLMDFGVRFYDPRVGRFINPSKALRSSYPVRF